MNSLVQVVGGQAVTTSLAVAEGTEIAHASVIKLVRTYISDLERFGRVGFEIAPFETAGGMQTREIANLNEQQATLLLTLMRNSPVVVAFKVRLVSAFYELARSRQADPLAALNDPAALRHLLSDYAGRVLELQGQVAAQAPKVQALERIEAAEGSLCITDAAKALHMRPKDLFDWLREHTWIYKRTGCASWLGYQHVLMSGYLEHHTTTRRSGSDEVGRPIERIFEQVRVTPKGLAKLAKHFAEATA